MLTVLKPGRVVASEVVTSAESVAKPQVKLFCCLRDRRVCYVTFSGFWVWGGLAQEQLVGGGVKAWGVGSQRYDRSRVEVDSAVGGWACAPRPPPHHIDVADVS